MGIVRQAEIHTIQELPDAKTGEHRKNWFGVIERGPLLPAYGTRRRLLWQRYYDRYDTNNIWMGASAGMGKKIASTPYELRGPKGLDIRHWEALYRNADFGRGYTSLIKKLTRDFFRYDIGAWMEIIGPGDPMLPMLGAPTGLAILDPLNIWPTGDPAYPAFYSRESGLHLLHKDRVAQFVDAPETDENFPGWGLSALTRAITCVQQVLLMNRYVNEQLDDTPPSGFMVANNIQPEAMRQALAMMKSGMDTDEPDVLGKTIFIYTDFAENPAKLEAVSMATPPEKFDYEQYININVDAVALALGVDRQELWQLTGSGLGTGTQSAILHAKSRGRTQGDLLSLLTRTFNDLMPAELELEYKYRDADEDALQAQTRQSNYNAVLSVSSTLSTDEQRRLLTLLDSSAADVLTDPDGELISFDDADKRPIDEDVMTDDETEITEESPEGEAEPEERPVIKALKRFRLTKDFADTAGAFAQTFVDVMNEGLDSEINRRRFGIIMRNELRRFGRRAYEDGLEEGGVNPDNFDNEDNERVLELAQSQSVYVTDLGTTVYKEGVSEGEVFRRAALWASKSLRLFLHAGINSAARNGTFMWQIGPTEEHCRSCLSANGKVAKFKTWLDRDILPGSSRLLCGGWKCLCKFTRTDQKVTGGLSRIPVQ